MQFKGFDDALEVLEHVDAGLDTLSLLSWCVYVDELVEFSEHDPELSDGLKWLDGEAQKKGLSFYDMVYQVLYKHDVNSKAKEWLNSRN